MSNESRFEEPDDVGFVSGGLIAEGSMSQGRMARREVRESGERPSSATT
jgi:hypothetical protein